MLPEVLTGFRWRDAIDVALVAAVLYRIFVMFKGTRAVQMLAGLGLLMAGSVAARRLELHSTRWILDNFWSFWVIALIVLFQPELRRALAQAGRGRLLQNMLDSSRGERAQALEDVVRAAETLAARRIGALIGRAHV